MGKVYLVLLSILTNVTVNAQIYNNAFKIQSSGTDRGMRITTDNAGNVVTTGYFDGLADFDPGVGTASLTPGSSQDVYIAKYDASLNYIWAVKFGTNGTDFPYALAVDASNNIIVGGDVSSNNRDGFVNKYDANGILTWSISIGGINKDVVYGVKTDDAKSVYVTGYFENTVDFDPGAGTYTMTSSGGRDIFLAKYDSTGKFTWAFKMGGTLSVAYEEGGQDIAISGANIYLTGNFEGTTDFNPAVGTNTLISNGSLDMFVAKYDTTGAYIWAISMGSINKHDYSYALDIDASENVYITGGFEETVDFDPIGTYTLTSASMNAQDIFISKYNSTGAFQWAFQIGGNTSVDDHAFDIDVTPTGDIYICGEVWGPADFDPSAGTYNIYPSNDQIFFAKYTNTGAFVWAFDIGATSSNGSADNGYGVQATAAGSLYVTGDFNGTADFDPSANTATLSSSSGDAFVGVYGTSVFAGINTIVLDGAYVIAFPNPCNGQVNFSYAGFNNNEWSIELTNVTGKPVLKTENIQTATLNLNITNLSAGLYFYTIRTGNKVITKKLVLQ